MKPLHAFPVESLDTFLGFLTVKKNPNWQQMDFLAESAEFLDEECILIQGLQENQQEPAR